MLIDFFDHEGIVYHEFAAAGQTINQHFHLAVLKRLRDAMRRKRSSGRQTHGSDSAVSAGFWLTC